MVYVAVVIALAGLILVWASNRRVANLEARLVRTTSSLYEMRSRLDELQETFIEQSADLRFEMRKHAGEINLSPAMTIGEITALHPAAANVLANFHLGGCHSCAVGPQEVLGEVCTERGLDQQGILAALERLGSGGSSGPAEPVRTPNIQLVM